MHAEILAAVNSLLFKSHPKSDRSIQFTVFMRGLRQLALNTGRTNNANLYRIVL